jgi:ketopantoate hydroxymethyltransferase
MIMRCAAVSARMRGTVIGLHDEPLRRLVTVMSHMGLTPQFGCYKKGTSPVFRANDRPQGVSVLGAC